MEVIEIIKLGAFIIVIVGFYSYQTFNGYYDFAYKKYKRAYDEYRAYVLTKKKSYNRYVSDFINENQFISSGEKQPSEYELNARNKSLLSLFELLETGAELVAKHFAQAKFTYRMEYRELISEWNKYKKGDNSIILNAPTLFESVGSIKIEDVTSLENMIFLVGEKKKVLLERIEQHLNTGAKGKSVAFMIIALRELGYLTSASPNRLVFKAIRSHFGANIGSDKGIYHYLEETLASQFRLDIENLTTYFKVK